MQHIVTILIVLALIVWVGYRQTAWAAVDPSTMWKKPLILAVVGVLSLANTEDAGISHLSVLGAALLVIEVILSVGIGALMGVVSTFRPIPKADHDRLVARAARRGRKLSTDIRLEVRTGGLGLLLWVALITVRIVLGVVAGQADAAPASAVGAILLVVAVNRAARIAVILSRAGHLQAPESVTSLA
jgi:hypothetical protein